MSANKEVKAYGAYALLRQAGEDLEQEFRCDFPSLYNEFVSIALIDLVEGVPEDGNYQEPYGNSVLSLWFPGLDFSEKALRHRREQIALPENREMLLMLMKSIADLCTRITPDGELDDSVSYELRSIYRNVRYDRNARYRSRYGDWLTELLSKAYLSRLEDIVVYTAQEAHESYGYNEEDVDDADWYDVGMEMFIKEANSVNLIITPTSVSITPVPERLREFLSREECPLDLSPAKAMVNR